jgi:hypothetical protein
LDRREAIVRIVEEARVDAMVGREEEKARVQVPV